MDGSRRELRLKGSQQLRLRDSLNALMFRERWRMEYIKPQTGSPQLIWSDVDLAIKLVSTVGLVGELAPPPRAW